MQAPDSLPAQHPPLSFCDCHPYIDSDLSSLSSEPSCPSESDLSSIASRSPSPPPGYMSPISSQSIESRDSSDESKIKKRSRTEGEENAPVRKKRRTPESKERTRQDLDLRALEDTTDQDAQLRTLLNVLRKRRKIVVVAGAGISVSAGIPDFRSSTGLFKTLKSEHKLKASGKALFDASVYQTEESRTSFHDMVRDLSTTVSAAKPTAFHRMLDRLAEEGRLMRLYTQNVDGIDTRMPNLQTTVPLPTKGPWPRSVQVHGGLEKMVCTKCHQLSDFQPELFEGPSPPPCATCVEADRVRTDHAGKRSHGIGCLRPRMVLYNEHNPDEEAIGSCMSADLRARPDALIVVGTSMKIPGVKRLVREMCGVVRSRRDGLTVWANFDDPPPGKEFDDCWDLVVKGPCDELAHQWTIAEEQGSCSSSDVERAKDNSGKLSVVVPPSPTKKARKLGMVTPASTPEQPATKVAATVPRIWLKVNPQKVQAEMKQRRKPGRPKKETGLPNSQATGGSKKNKKAAAPSQKPLPALTSHFKVAKTGTVRASEKKVKKEAMGSLSSTDPRVNGPPTLEGLPEPAADLFKKTTASDIPTTPVRVEVPACQTTDVCSATSSNARTTISPKSVPNGMANLLD